MTKRRWEPEGFADLDAYLAYRDTKKTLPPRQPQERRLPPCLPDCPLCNGRRWVAVPDPLFDGALIDQACPACCDHSIRATRICYDNEWGAQKP
jgi:hypothetical protein